MKLFIVWSGKAGEQIAQVFHNHFKEIPGVDPYFSPVMESGNEWPSKLAEALQGAGAGLICLTPESLKSDWVYFEAGALWRAVPVQNRGRTSENKERLLWLYLDGVDKKDLKAPLNYFQIKNATKDSTRELLTDIMNRLSPMTRPDYSLKSSFPRLWRKIVEVQKKNAQAAEARITLDQRFWGPCFLNSGAHRSKVKIVYNDMLCFRDYLSGVLVRHTDYNRYEDQKEASKIDEFTSSVHMAMKNIGYIGQDEAKFLHTRDYLLAGEVEARDKIKEWFQRQCNQESGYADIDCEISNQIDETELDRMHLILLGNLRTNWLIFRAQNADSDFRFQMETEKMGWLRIRDASKEEEKKWNADWNLDKSSKRDGNDLLISDDAYDPRSTTRSFVVLSRCSHPVRRDHGTCTIISSFNNAAIGSVAKELVTSDGVQTLLGDLLQGRTFPHRFQCLFQVYTEVKKDPRITGRPVLIAFKKY